MRCPSSSKGMASALLPEAKRMSKPEIGGLFRVMTSLVVSQRPEKSLPPPFAHRVGSRRMNMTTIQDETCLCLVIMTSLLFRMYRPLSVGWRDSAALKHLSSPPISKFYLRRFSHGFNHSRRIRVVELASTPIMRTAGARLKFRVATTHQTRAGI